MEFTTLGRTGLRVSVAALGCGGGSRLGKSKGRSGSYSVNIVKKAIELGANFIVIGRPILLSKDPLKEIKKINLEIEQNKS